LKGEKTMVNKTATQEYATDDDDDIDEVEDEEIKFLKDEMLQAEEPRPRKNARRPKSSLPDLSTGVPVTTRIAQEEWKKLKTLEKHYHVDRPQDALRLAIYDAYDHITEVAPVEPQEQPQAYADLLASQADLTEQLKRLSDNLEASLVPEEEEEVGEAEPEVEEVSPYDPKTFAYFKNLDGKGKKYLTEQLNGNPNTRSLGNLPTWKREINAHINKVAPHDGYRGHAPATRQARRNLLDYLLKEVIL
jgi:hypothetical protein